MTTFRRTAAYSVASLALLTLGACAVPASVTDADPTVEAAGEPAPPPIEKSPGTNQVTGAGIATAGTGGEAGAGGAAGEAGAGGAAGAAGAAGSGGDGGSGGVVSQPGLEAYYGFDDAAGTIKDASGHGHHGAVMGSGVSLVSSGKVGGALSLAGSDGRVLVPGSTQLDFVSAATIEFWVKLSSVSLGTVLSRLTAGGEGVRVTSSQGNLQVAFTRTSGSASVTSDMGQLGSSWVHVAIVNDGSELRLYLGGKLHKSATGGQLGYIGTDLAIGRSSPADKSINGYLDEMKWWTVARSQEQICGDAGGQWLGGECTLP